MADEGLSVTITNQAAFDAAMGQIRKNVENLSGPLQAAGRELIAKAEQAAPRRTGRLAGSHKVLPASGSQVRVTADVAYAAPIHWGWPGHGISRQPWLVATWLRDSAPLAKMSDAIQADIDKAAAST